MRGVRGFRSGAAQVQRRSGSCISAGELPAQSGAGDAGEFSQRRVVAADLEVLKCYIEQQRRPSGASGASVERCWLTTDILLATGLLVVTSSITVVGSSRP